MLLGHSALLGLQGFASGDLEKDATAVRMFTDAGVEMLLSQVDMLSSSLLNVNDINGMLAPNISHLCSLKVGSALAVFAAA